MENPGLSIKGMKSVEGDYILPPSSMNEKTDNSCICRFYDIRPDTAFPTCLWLYFPSFQQGMEGLL